MMNAAAGIFLAARRKKGWTNPYVTDGLVAMWDGEWNAGGGVHDASATTWVDLSGTGNDLTVTAPAYFDDDSFHVNQVDGAARTANPIGDVYTLEFCGIETRNDAGLTFAWKSVNRFVCHRSSLVENFGNAGPGFVVSNGELFSGGEIYDSLTSPMGGVFKNGAIISGTSGAHFSSFSHSGFGARGSDYPSSAIVKCLRLYNRKLTVAEIASNYAVDKARFNLP